MKTIHKQIRENVHRTSIIRCLYTVLSFCYKQREEYDGLIYGAFHMSKLHWNTVEIAGNVPRDLIYELIDHSYELVVKGLTRKLKDELRNL